MNRDTETQRDRKAKTASLMDSNSSAVTLTGFPSGEPEETIRRKVTHQNSEKEVRYV